ncbi:cation acetate symporter [Pigmentiphaga aceris]|uniref:Cation acetate symporter n=1 Tax=Pigmentiphaga aceris TaxID=1940612 RepID=A0A5C0B515_9BURK|nr:cation acetate symporter [Pigmentiphaga aceris]
MAGGATQRAFEASLKRVYLWFALSVLVFVGLLAIMERFGLPRDWIGYIFLLATVSLYAGIGIMSRTSDAAEYYVAGRRVPAIFNGMAVGADWMSAASFLSLAGTLYLSGYGGLAYVMGWTGGYCLVALLLAPYLRKFGQYTIPDFLGARYGGNLPRLLGVLCALVCSFTYLVAQVYGVGLIATRMTGVAFELGIFIGLGGMLVCSFLGGMRAITWTQVAQYIVLMIAYLIPVIWLSVKHTGIPVPQLVYGSVLEQVSEREKQLANDPAELEVRRIYQHNADVLGDRLSRLPGSWVSEKVALQKTLQQYNQSNAPLADIKAAERELNTYPASPEQARVRWTEERAAFEARAGPPLPHAEPFPAADEAGSDTLRRNFLALVFCLTLGTAGLPHILVRYYTTPSVREARRSVVWSLFFICLLYFTAPALAVLVKYDMYNVVVGSEFMRLPAWVSAWNSVDASLLSITDVNRDGLVQLAEIGIGADIVVLAMPEIGGLPYVISGLVAAGGLAAALSTADGLLLTISNALSHDTYHKVISPLASPGRRVMVSKLLLLIVALAAAYVAARKPADILFTVTAAFSFAASTFFPVLVLGIFWKRANKWGAVAGFVCGLGVTFAYMVATHPPLRELLLQIPRSQPVRLLWDIQPLSAGVFGVPAAFAAVIIVSLLTRPPDAATRALVDFIRVPSLPRPAVLDPDQKGE